MHLMNSPIPGAHYHLRTAPEFTGTPAKVAINSCFSVCAWSVSRRPWRLSYFVETGNIQLRPPCHFLSQKGCSKPGLSQLPYWDCPQATRHDYSTKKMLPLLWEKGSHPMQKARFLISQGELQPCDQRSESKGLGARRHLWPQLQSSSIRDLILSLLDSSFPGKKEG